MVIRAVPWQAMIKYLVIVLLKILERILGAM
jgi:hypothetical protein